MPQSALKAVSRALNIRIQSHLGRRHEVCDVLARGFGRYLAPGTEDEAACAVHFEDKGTRALVDSVGGVVREKVTDVQVPHQRSLPGHDVSCCGEVNRGVQAEDVGTAVGKEGERGAAVTADVKHGEQAGVVSGAGDLLESGQQERFEVRRAEDDGSGDGLEEHDCVGTGLGVALEQGCASGGEAGEEAGGEVAVAAQHAAPGFDADGVGGGGERAADEGADEDGVVEGIPEARDGLDEDRDAGGEDSLFEGLCVELLWGEMANDDGGLSGPHIGGGAEGFGLGAEVHEGENGIGLVGFDGEEEGVGLGGGILAGALVGDAG